MAKAIKQKNGTEINDQRQCDPAVDLIEHPGTKPDGSGWEFDSSTGIWERILAICPAPAWAPPQVVCLALMEYLVVPSYEFGRDIVPMVMGKDGIEPGDEMILLNSVGVLP